MTYVEVVYVHVAIVNPPFRIPLEQLSYATRDSLLFSENVFPSEVLQMDQSFVRLEHDRLLVPVSDQKATKNPRAYFLETVHDFNHFT
jgi:hypothetical protein